MPFTVKLVPIGDRYNLRVEEPNVFSGYLGRTDLTRDAFDEDGYFRVGDAVQFANPTDPSEGLRFAGRSSENFKLSNGTWVLTGELRSAVVEAAGGIAEAVAAGHDRDDIRLLLWPSPGIGESPADLIRGELQAYNGRNRSASTRIAAFLIVTDAPALANGELTNKGYVNQRAVLTNRAQLVEALYGGGKNLIILDR